MCPKFDHTLSGMELGWHLNFLNFWPDWCTGFPSQKCIWICFTHSLLPLREFIPSLLRPLMYFWKSPHVLRQNSDMHCLDPAYSLQAEMTLTGITGKSISIIISFIQSRNLMGFMQNLIRGPVIDRRKLTPAKSLKNLVLWREPPKKRAFNEPFLIKSSPNNIKFFVDSGWEKWFLIHARNAGHVPKFWPYFIRTYLRVLRGYYRTFMKLMGFSAFQGFHSPLGRRV